MSPTGSVYGTALNVQGTPVIEVTATIVGSGAAQTAKTDAKGLFHFLNLSPGDYSVSLDGTGFAAARREVTILPGKSVFLSIPMSLAGVAEAITVRSDASDLDSHKIQTGATYGQRELESIPTTRDPWAILRQVPGVLVADVNVGDRRIQRQSTFVGKGSHPDQNSYSLDGVAISLGGVSPLYFDFDSFSNIDVATGGSDPSLATPGVTLDLVTKRGTNQLRGSSRALYSGGAGWDYGVEAGGPAWKDRLWLWGAVARNAFLGDTLFDDTGEAVRVQETLKYWNGKLDAAFVPANALTLTYTNFDRVSLGRSAGPEFSKPSTRDNKLPSEAMKIADSHVLSASLFASIYLSYAAASPTDIPEGGPDVQADLDAEGVWRHSFPTWRLRDYKHQAGFNSSAFFDTGDLRHELKFGFGYRHVRFDSASSWPGDLLVGYAPFQQAAITRLEDINSEVNAYNLFVGDTVQIGNLTVNVGARFDYQQGKNLPSSVPANPAFPDLLPAVQYAGDSGYPVTWRQVQPRVGVTYALGSHSTLLRASYSRFADQQTSTLVTSINAFPSIAGLYYGWSDPNGNGRVEPDEIDLSNLQFAFSVDPNNPGSSQQVNQISKSLRTPTTDELILGVERQIASDFTGSLSYTYRVSRGLLFFPLIGTTPASYQYLGNATGTATASDGFVLNFSEPYYGLTTDPPPLGFEVRNRPDFREIYNGVELQILKAFSHGWMARMSFAYNDWRQRVGAGGIVNPNNETPGTNANGPVVESGINATWQFNLSGMVELPFGIAAGVNLFGRQGFPIPYWIDVQTNDSNFNTPSIQIGQATRYRTPDVYQLALQVSRVFRIGPSVMVIPQFACFNLLNSHTVLQRDGAVGLYDDGARQVVDFYGTFNSVVQVLSSRVFRGGVRITF